MAVIQTIRNKYGKIAGGIIAVALVGFIVSDATSGSLASLFNGRDPNVMNIDGTKIDPKEYSARVKEYEVLYSMYNQSRNLDDATRAQMSEQLIQMMVYEAAVNEECDKLGITVSEEEKKELVYGGNADRMVQQFQINGQQIFSDPQSGQFDPGRVKGLEKELSERGDKIDPDGRVREQWAAVKAYVNRSARSRKYSSLFTNAAYMPKYQMKKIMGDQNGNASIKYVKVPFTNIADNDVKVTDEEIKAYMQKHASMYTNDEATRSIEYVSFDIVPSSADTERALTALNEMKDDFATTKDNESFVNSRSDVMNSYTSAYYNKRTLTSRNADTILNLPVGVVYGPYYENDGYNLVKVTDRKTLPDSTKVRHILVKTKEQGNDVRTDSAASMRMDSALAMLKGGMPFDSVVKMFTDDDPSKGGEYTFTLRDRPNLSKEFADFAFEGKAGETKKVKVSNDNYAGYHYIEILEQKGIAPSTQIALVTKNLIPSDSTINALYGKANEFAGKNTTADAFDATAKKDKLDKRIGDDVKVSNFTIGGLGPAREVVRWMYDAETKVGKVSGVFQLGDERYVVVKLAAINEKGLKPLNPIDRPMLEQKVKEEKKAEMIAKKFSGKSVDAIAAETQQEVMQADTVILGGSYVANLGYEPKVVGYTFNPSFQPNTVSPGIKGQGGVYFVTVLNRVNNPLPPDGGMMDQIIGQQRAQQERQMANAMEQGLQKALTKKVNVKYYPANF
jgi:peptidyl-prolyl cis-trans isomerase D